MKKWLSLLLAFLLMMTVPMASFAEGAEAAGENPGGTVEEDNFVFPAYAYDELTVGNPTPVEGNFFTDLWGNNTSDLDVR